MEGAVKKRGLAPTKVLPVPSPPLPNMKLLLLEHETIDSVRAQSPPVEAKIAPLPPLLTGLHGYAKKSANKQDSSNDAKIEYLSLQLKLSDSEATSV